MRQHESIMTARNLSVITPEGEPILRDVSVDVQRGERLLITGPSGAGKTTLLNALIGNVRADQVVGGSVTLLGQQLYASQRHRREGGWFGAKRNGALSASARDKLVRNHVGIYLQHPDLNGSWTVHQNLEEAQQLAEGASRRLEVTDIAARLGIDAILEDQTASKSGGQKQRIALGGLLLSQPELLVLDEPTSALSETDRCQALRTLVDISETYGMTAIMISHDDEAAGFATRTLQMRDGVVLDASQTQAI